MSAMWVVRSASLFDPFECSWFVEERELSCSGSGGVSSLISCVGYGFCGEGPYVLIGMLSSSSRS